MFSIGGRPRGLQSFVSSVRSSLSRGKKALAEGASPQASGSRRGSQASSSGESFGAPKDHENPYLLLLPSLPRSQKSPAHPSAQAAITAHDVFARAQPAVPLAAPPTVPHTFLGAGLSRRNAVRAGSAGVAVRPRGRASSEASLRSVASGTPQASPQRAAGSFTEEMINSLSPLDRLMQQTSAPQGSSSAPAADKKPPGPGADTDLWAHLG